jgi:hypothetical protein
LIENAFVPVEKWREGGRMEMMREGDGGWLLCENLMGCSDSDAGLAPMSPLCVVSVREGVNQGVLFYSFLSSSSSSSSSYSFPCLIMGTGNAEGGGEVVPDGVTSPHSDPLRDGSVLLLGFGKLLLGAEGLVAL